MREFLRILIEAGGLTYELQLGTYRQVIPVWNPRLVEKAVGLREPKRLCEWGVCAKFKCVSGSPGYVGDLCILQGDALSDAPPMFCGGAKMVR